MFWYAETIHRRCALLCVVAKTMPAGYSLRMNGPTDRGGLGHEIDPGVGIVRATGRGRVTMPLPGAWETDNE